MTKSKNNDPHKLSVSETRRCVGMLLEALQNASYHGNVTLKFRDGELFNVETSQSIIPRSILEETSLCVLIRNRHGSIKEANT